MITLLPYDALTVPRPVASSLPGVSEGYWREVNCEEFPNEDRHVDINAEMRQVTPWEVEPWPEQLPGKMWVDWCPEYAGETDGLLVNLHHLETETGTCAVVPAGEAYLDEAPEEELRREEARISRLMTWREVQSYAIAPTEWYRLDTRNEALGTRLLAPARIIFDGVRGSAFRLEIPDQSLWTPFDLRRGLDGYYVVSDDGMRVDDSDAAAFLDFTQRSTHALYLRPRRLRIVVTVIAHYMYATFFELVLNDEIFTRAYFDRPPVYPERHDLLHTTLETPLYNYFGEPRSYDLGLDTAFSMSRTAGELAHEIVAAQFFDPCMAYVLVGYELPDMTVWAYPARAHDVVCGLGRIDTATGLESRIWLVQREDMSAEYPPRVLGQFLSALFRLDT